MCFRVFAVQCPAALDYPIFEFPGVLILYPVLQAGEAARLGITEDHKFELVSEVGERESVHDVVLRVSCFAPVLMLGLQGLPKLVPVAFCSFQVCLCADTCTLLTLVMQLTDQQPLIAHQHACAPPPIKGPTTTLLWLLLSVLHRLSAQSDGVHGIRRCMN
jgi:hypothetical protein